MIYRKKPVIIEAFKYDGDLMDKYGNYYVPQWAVEAHRNGMLFYSGEANDELFAKTCEGIYPVSVGDYIIKNATGELYLCEPYIFEQAYEVME